MQVQDLFRRRHRLALTALLPASAGLHAAADPLAPAAHWSAYTAGRASTPPMGWSSWNAFGTDIDEAKVQGTRLLAEGLYLSEQPGSVNPAVDGVARPQADPSIFRPSAGWTGTKGDNEQ